MEPSEFINREKYPWRYFSLVFLFCFVVFFFFSFLFIANVVT